MSKRETLSAKQWELLYIKEHKQVLKLENEVNSYKAELNRVRNEYNHLKERCHVIFGGENNG